MKRRFIPFSYLSTILLFCWLAITSLSYYAMTSMGLDMVESEFGAIENVLYTEHGLIENLQVALLALACLGFAISARKLQQQGKDIAQFFALLMVAFIVRELGLDVISETTVVLFPGDGRLIYVIPLVALVVKMLLDYQFYLNHLAIFFSTRSFQYVGISTICYGILSRIFEKSYIEVAYSGFWEESVEVAACLLLFAVGCRTIKPDLQDIQARIS
ncbi:MAG: hypothetical protein ACPH7H_07815, partial [Porticoccaceae bacterium]